MATRIGSIRDAFHTLR